MGWVMKQYKIIAVFGIFTLCFISHFAYDVLPNFIFSILFPVNESIIEHMKIIFTSYLLYGLIDYFLIKKYKPNNFVLQLFLVPLISIVLYLIIYIPLFNNFGEKMFISISLLFIIIIISQIISYYILNYKEIKYQKFIGTIGIILVYILFFYITYYPPIHYLFKDFTNNTYGILKTT